MGAVTLPGFSFFAQQDGYDRFKLTLVLSIALHLTLLAGVRFKLPEMKKADPNPALQVVLVNSKSATRPVKADALAQANLDGGGNTDAARRAQSPLPATEKNQKQSDAKEKPSAVSELEQKAQTLMTQVKDKTPVETSANKTPSNPEPRAETISASDLRQRSLDAARLEAQISRDWDKYQERPKRKFIGARTQEFRFARYVEDWRIKVEKIGNLNYPDEARRNKIYGSLALTVSIKSSGEIETVEINRSSGHKVLDDAAIRIVRLAAPYSPFPDDIRRDTDIIGITRTWTFTRADQLVSE